jgi:DNA-binding transcriptional regulator YdaS (Cro superfamily)
MKISEYLQQKNLSQTWLGEQLGITQSAVSQHIAHGWPAEHCPKIERLTKGAVTCEELNDKVDWTYVRASARDKRKAERRHEERRTKERRASTTN